MEKNDDKVVFGLKVLSTDISDLYGGITLFASDTAIEDVAVWLHSAALSVVWFEFILRDRQSYEILSAEPLDHYNHSLPSVTNMLELAKQGLPLHDRMIKLHSIAASSAFQQGLQS